MGKLGIGDKVRVITKDGDGSIVGRIVDIDDTWVYPYEVQIEGEEETLLCGSHELDLLIEPKTILMMPLIKEDKEESYINIKFQEGAIQEVGVNGAQIENVIDVLIERLEGFQKGGYPCRENALAITKLEEARMWLNERTRKRKEQGIEGKSEKHE